MDTEFAEALQLEITNRCNFKCQMCMRQAWNAKPKDVEFALYRKIAELYFPKLKRLVLYGFGEPFIHPRIIEILKMAREKLPREAAIIVSTNGSAPKTIDKILTEIGIDNISFSIDTTSQAKLSRIRKGSKPRLITKNVRQLAKNRGKAKRDFKLGIEAVIMADNFRDLPELVKFSGENDVDYITASHVVPYTKEVYAKTVYLTLSKPTLEIMNPALKFGSKLIHESAVEVFGKAYGVEANSGLTQQFKSFWAEAEKMEYWINLPLLLNSADKLETLNTLEEHFRKSEKAAHQYQIDLKLPNIYPDAKERSCPYVEKKTLVVRSDGKVSPCSEFTYSHPVYINAHRKDIHEITFGSVENEDVDEIWCKEAYVNFRKIRENIPEKMPWCGDCPYSALGCFYTKTNSVDCYANEASCSECLYSVNLAQCNI